MRHRHHSIIAGRQSMSGCLSDGRVGAHRMARYTGGRRWLAGQVCACLDARAPPSPRSGGWARCPV
jgi:hypothetical protein